MTKTINIDGGVQSGPASVSGAVNVEDAKNAVDRIQDLPPGASENIKKFIEENFRELVEKVETLLDFPVPESIAEWWPQVVEAITEILKAIS